MIAVERYEKTRPGPAFRGLPANGRSNPVIWGFDPGPGASPAALAARLLNNGPVTLTHDPLGRPLLWVGGERGPSISFSRGGGAVWGALSYGAAVGCDWCGPEEFRGAYPLLRAFSRQEFDGACELGFSPARTAALLWSVKEAAVKALGVGFYRLDPLAVSTRPTSPGKTGVYFRVNAGGRRLPAWARRMNGGWLALAAAGAVIKNHEWAV